MIRSDSNKEYGVSVNSMWNTELGVSSGVTTTLVESSWDDFVISVDGMSANADVPTGFQYTKRFLKDMHGTITVWRQNNAGEICINQRIETEGAGWPAFGPRPDQSFYADVSNEAAVKFWDNVTNSGINLAQDLIEIGQTTQLVQQVVQTVINLKKDFKKTVLRAGKRPADTASGLFLQGLYGVTPTLNTIHDLANYEARKLGATVPIKARRSQVREKVTEGDDFNTYTVKDSYRIEHGAVLKVPPHDTLQRLTSLDPSVIIWEVLPYSFVFDWFMDIGGTLAALEAKRRYSAFLSNHYQTTTQKTRWEHRERRPYVKPAWLHTSTQRHLDGVYEKKICSRAPSENGPGISMPNLSIPDLGYGQMTAVVAMAYQASR